MPKPPRRTMPPFLKRKLEHKKMSLAKKHLPAFLEKIRKEYKDELPGALFLVEEFCDHLAMMDKDFKNIDGERLKTNQPGTYQLYNLIRKRTQLLEEEVQPSTSQKHRTAESNAKPKPVNTTKEEKDASEDPPVKITADEHIHLGDEKKVNYRKRLDTDVDAEDLANDPEFGEENEEEDDDITLYGEEKFARLKHYMVKQIDMLEVDEIEMIKFEFDAKINQMYFQCWKTQTTD